MSNETVWPTIRLGDHAYVKGRIGWRGLKSSEYTQEGPCLIAGYHIESGRVNWGACDHIPMCRYTESWEIALREADVILTKDGTIGRVALVRDMPGPATINSTMMLVRPRGPVLSGFLYHYLTGNAFQKLVADKVSGSSVPHVFQRDMVELTMPLPSQKDQLHIAKILDTADDTIRQTERVIAKLKAVKAGLLHDLLTRGLDENGELRDPEKRPEEFKDSPLGRIPGQWEIGGIRQFLRLHDGIKPGPFGSNITKRMYRSEGYRVYGQEQVIAGDLSMGDYYISPSKYFEMNAFSLQEGDLLISLVGTIGRVLVVRIPFEPGVINPRLIRLRPARNEADVEFLKHLMISDILQQQLEKMAQGGTMPVLSGRILRKLIVARPPLQEQSRIAAILDAQDGLIRSEKQMIEELRQVKQGLLDDLLTGQVRVNHTEGTET